MEERAKIVSGFIFIIPNEAVTKKNAMDGYWEAEKKRLHSRLGIELKDSDVLVQVWVGNGKCDNWTCNPEFSSIIDDENWDALEEKLIRTQKKTSGYFNYLFPRCLPKRILKGLKEGDILKLKCDTGVTLELTADQSTKRYRYLGTFEKALESVSL